MSMRTITTVLLSVAALAGMLTVLAYSTLWDEPVSAGGLAIAWCAFLLGGAAFALAGRRLPPPRREGFGYYALLWSILVAPELLRVHVDERWPRMLLRVLLLLGFLAYYFVFTRGRAERRTAG